MLLTTAVMAVGAVLWWSSATYPAELPLVAPWDFSWIEYLGIAFPLIWYLRGLSLTNRLSRPHWLRQTAFLAGVALIYGTLSWHYRDRAAVRAAEEVTRRRYREEDLGEEDLGEEDLGQGDLFGGAVPRVPSVPHGIQAASAWPRYRRSVHDFAGQTQACRGVWQDPGIDIKEAVRPALWHDFVTVLPCQRRSHRTLAGVIIAGAGDATDQIRRP